MRCSGVEAPWSVLLVNNRPPARPRPAHARGVASLPGLSQRESDRPRAAGTPPRDPGQARPPLIIPRAERRTPDPCPRHTARSRTHRAGPYTGTTGPSCRGPRVVAGCDGRTPVPPAPAHRAPVCRGRRPLYSHQFLGRQPREAAQAILSSLKPPHGRHQRDPGARTAAGRRSVCAPSLRRSCDPR